MRLESTGLQGSGPRMYLVVPARSAHSYTTLCPLTQPIIAANLRVERLDWMTALTPKFQNIAEKVIALRELTKTTGFQTSRSQGELLGRLTPDELVAVALVLNAK